MASFEFSQGGTTAAHFNGPLFYHVYKDAEFLRVNANVETLLSRGYEMRQKLKNVARGESLIIEGMKLEKNTPLIVKRAGAGINVEDFEFTCNRLQGLVAAYAYENRQRFPALEASEAKVLGLVWDNQNEERSKLYLSAVSGTDHMIEQFSYFPFLCGLRKFQLKKIPVELVAGMGYVKNNDGVTMAKLMKSNLVTAKRIWLIFPGTSLRDLENTINGTPQLKKLYQS